MKPRWIATSAWLVSLMLAPGIVLAQRPTPPPVTRADVAIRPTVTLGGQPLSRGTSIRLNDAQATRSASGLCIYAMAYDVVNAGAGRTEAPVVARLRVDGAVVTTQPGILLAAGQATRLTALVSLRPGAHAVHLELDDPGAASTPRRGEPLRFAVTVDGPCGGAPTAAPTLPKIEGPSSGSTLGTGGSLATAPDAASKALGSYVTKLKAWNGVGWKGLTTEPNFLDSAVVVVDINRKDLVWWFQWSTTMPGVKAAQWQVAHVPFGPSTGHSDGSIEAPVPPPGKTADFTIDLAPYRWLKGTKAESPGSVQAKSAPKPQLPSFDPGSVIPGQQKKPSGPTYVEAPLSIYVRVVPLDGAGKPMAPASPAVQLVFKEIEQPKIVITTNPTVTFAGSVAGQPDAFLAWCYVVAPHDVYLQSYNPATSQPTKTLFAKKGEHRNTCQGGGGWDPIGDFFNAWGAIFGAGVDLTKMIADFAAATWNSAKGAVVSAVASVLKDTVGCPGWCHTALESALNAGLVALGLPPTLPNFDALVSMGEDYIATQVAQELAKQSPVPIPPDVLKEAGKQAAKEFVAQAKSKANGPTAPDWIPDPAKQYQPLVIKLQIDTGTGYGAGVKITLKDPGGKHYKDKEVALPILPPKQVVVIPVTLDPVIGPHDWAKLYPGQGDLPSSKCGQDPFMSPYQPPEDTPEQKAAKAKYQECTKQFQDLFALKMKFSEGALQEWTKKYTTEPITLTTTVSGGTPNKLTAGPTIGCQSALKGCTKK